MYGIELPVQIVPKKLVRPRLNVFYPVVTGLSNTDVEQKINEALLNLTNKIITDQGYFQNPMTEISGSYEIKTNEKSILSLSLLNDAYSGGAHGIRLIRSITFDTETGRIYNLKDLFKPGSDYVGRLSQIVGRQIRDRGIYLLGPFKGISPNQDFYIADKSLVIYFQLYELTSYAYGFPYFPISVYEVRDIIDDKGPLNKLRY